MTLAGNKSRLSWAAMIVASVAAASGPQSAQAAPAALPAAEAPGGALQATLESKTRLIKLLLTQSPAVRRIPQSDNAQARKKLAEAQSLVARADGEAAAGRTDAAVKLLDEALRDIVAATRLVPDAGQQAAQERARYTALSEMTRTFLQLHKNLSARMAAKKVQAPASALDVGKVNGLLEKAETLAAGGRHKEANALLNDAYKAAVSALNGLLMSETIVYDQKFDSPAEEFQHELARNRSYEELIPIALAQLNTPRETALLSERYTQQSKDLRDTAQKQAAGGDYPAALKSIQDATAQLQRSLRIVGVIVPQASER
ncbi:MAG TPA: hypothetical protein VJ652_10870 [Noviherbaspirillum sp.]|nr:hypothetical protein [Noviherbaspirillum sp.]